MGYAGLVAGPSTAQVAKCATCFAQDDSVGVGLKKNKQQQMQMQPQQQQPIQWSIRCAQDDESRGGVSFFKDKDKDKQ
jgi:hypothetical protein